MVLFFGVILILAGVFFAGMARSGKLAASESTVSRYSIKPSPSFKSKVCTIARSNNKDEGAEMSCLDSRARSERVKRHAVTLALAVSAADGKICKSELTVIGDWAKEAIVGEGDESAQTKTRRQVDKAIRQAAKLLGSGSRVDTYGICKEVAETAPISQQYSILDLCLQVGGASGVVSPEELDMLAKFAQWLGVDEDRFRGMMEKVLPVTMHKVEDRKVVLGIRPGMSKENIRQFLNKAYSKWNGRVTHLNPEIRAQAGHMLKLIAETRNEYIG